MPTRQVHYFFYGRPSSTVAHFDIKDGRVVGYVERRRSPGQDYSTKPFNVKCTDEGFSVGGGSSKQRFYFKNEITVAKD